MRNVLYTALAAITMMVGLTFGLQSAASAAPANVAEFVVAQANYEAASEDVSVKGWPTGCYYQKHGNGALASCSNSNGGSYKASVICTPYDGGDLIVRDATVWKTSGPSIVNCPPLSSFYSAGINKRSTH